MREQLIVRADATARMGTGHLMRCLALAESWRARGGMVTFLSYCENAALRQRVISQDFRFLSIGRMNPDPADLEHALDLLQKVHDVGEIPWVALDGYHFDSDYQLGMKEKGCRLLVIDDMNHLNHYYGDVLLNQNLNADQLIYSCEPYTRLLLGTRYGLLRSEFLDWKNWRREIPDVARRMLVTLGGGDPHNVTLQVINALKVANIADLEVKIIAGPSNPHIKTLKKAIPRAQSNMNLLSDPENMAELMAWADVAVSAGGSTCWEMCFMRLPLLTIILAENQKNISQGLERAGIGISCGWYHELDDKSLAKLFTHLIYDRERRTRMSGKAGQLVDGFGIKRTIDTMATIS